MWNGWTVSFFWIYPTASKWLLFYLGVAFKTVVVPRCRFWDSKFLVCRCQSSCPFCTPLPLGSGVQPTSILCTCVHPVIPIRTSSYLAYADEPTTYVKIIEILSQLYSCTCYVFEPKNTYRFHGRRLWMDQAKMWPPAITHCKNATLYQIDISRYKFSMGTLV